MHTTSISRTGSSFHVAERVAFQSRTRGGERGQPNMPQVHTDTLNKRRRVSFPGLKKVAVSVSSLCHRYTFITCSLVFCTFIVFDPSCIDKQNSERLDPDNECTTSNDFTVRLQDERNTSQRYSILLISSSDAGEELGASLDHKSQISLVDKLAEMR